MNDVVLVSLREFEDDKCDILHGYKSSEVLYLQKLGELPHTIKTSDKMDVDDGSKNDIGIDFTDGDSDDDDKTPAINFDEI